MADFDPYDVSVGMGHQPPPADPNLNGNRRVRLVAPPPNEGPHGVQQSVAEIEARIKRQARRQLAARLLVIAARLIVVIGTIWTVLVVREIRTEISANGRAIQLLTR